MSEARRWRGHAGASLSLRAGGAEGSPRAFTGYAVVFDSWTTLWRGDYGGAWEVREVIRPGAFRNALSESQDVRALWNHDANHVLGRTTAGTLRLREDAKGLAVEIDPPDTQVARDLAVSVGRGDVSQMSFAFLPRKGGERITLRSENDVEITEIEILDADLFDVSPVTYPAYESTEFGVRGGGVLVRASAAAAVKSAWLAESREKFDALMRR